MSRLFCFFIVFILAAWMKGDMTMGAFIALFLHYISNQEKP
jgi:hypothetical protein